VCLQGGWSYIFHFNHFVFKRPCRCTGSYSSTSHDEVWVQCGVCPHVICGRSSDTGEGFFSEYFGFPPSVSFHQCSVIVLILLLPEGQARKSWEPSNKAAFFRLLEEYWTDKSLLIVFRFLRAIQLWLMCHLMF